tara:strand:+ start:1100 stop:1714 length:615 start_codon:yes stop_codon:yes gene_type:complete
MTAILKVDTIQDTAGNNIINESSNTITIGASGDTISIPSGATITNSGTANNFGGGKIGQVISSGIDYQQSTTSASNQDVLSANGTVWETAITPSATSSRIIVMANIYLYHEQNGNANNRGDLNLQSKTGAGSYSTLQTAQLGNYDYSGGGVQNRQRVPITFQISPSTTSAVTVKFQYQSSGGATSAINDGGTVTSTVLLWEVLA